MIEIILLLTIVAAIFGVTLLIYILRNKTTPKSFVLIHGLIASTVILLLAYYVFTHGAKFADVLVILIMGATFGVFTAYKDIFGFQAPKKVAIIHGLIMLTGFAWFLLKWL